MSPEAILSMSLKRSPPDKTSGFQPGGTLSTVEPTWPSDLWNYVLINGCYLKNTKTTKTWIKRQGQGYIFLECIFCPYIGKVVPTHPFLLLCFICLFKAVILRWCVCMSMCTLSSQGTVKNVCRGQNSAGI